jgi:hypothetical protein
MGYDRLDLLAEKPWFIIISAADLHRGRELFCRALRTRGYWARIGPRFDVINYSRCRIRGPKSTLTRHFGESGDGDQGVRMTSLVYSCHLLVRITRLKVP